MSVHLPVCISVCLAVSLPVSMSTCPHRTTQLPLDRLTENFIPGTSTILCPLDSSLVTIRQKEHTFYLKTYVQLC